MSAVLQRQNREKSRTTGRLIGQVNPIMPDVNKRILIVSRLTRSVTSAAIPNPPQ